MAKIAFTRLREPVLSTEKSRNLGFNSNTRTHINSRQSNLQIDCLVGKTGTSSPATRSGPCSDTGRCSSTRPNSRWTSPTWFSLTLPSLPRCSAAWPGTWLPEGYSQIFRSYVFGPSGFWTMAPLRCAAKFDPFLSLDCARVEGVGDQILPSCNLYYFHPDPNSNTKFS